MAAASSSPSSPPSNYEVFLSFRGKTRENFTSHLFAALSRKQIHTFMDAAIDKGDKISPQLLNDIIEGSRIAIIIFSKDCASSKWCLDELVTILECKEKIGQIVIPVFYHVHPSDVRKQTGDFGKAFGENEKRFKSMENKVQKWRDALTEASYLAGHESPKIRPEAKLVDVIVKDISKKLENTTFSVDSNGLVGIDSRIDEVKSLLCIGLQDFRIVGIWGMGGIGKTTLAEAVFHQISNQFKNKSFMGRVREESESYGLEHPRAQVLFEILEEDITIQTPNLPRYIKKRLQSMKAFIVLDDVNEVEQLEFLAGGLDRFGVGSRIIVTTRNKEVLEKCRVGYIYKVEGMNDHEAVEHFCNHAFKENHCPEDLMGLSQRVLDYAKGNPLALKVLGSFFHGKSKQNWEKAMHNLKTMPSPKIYDVLRISYDELDLEVKNIFLDIACFFKGDDKDQVTLIFDNLYSIHSWVDIFADKSLITISDNRLEVHDLIQELGWEIVRRESTEEPGKRGRLWHHMDILPVLNKNKKAPKLQYIDLRHSQYVTRICNILEALKLERVNLLNCINLSHISSSIQMFNNLVNLSLYGRTSLKCFPSNIHFRSPTTIDLSDCANLTEFSQILGNIMKLKLGGTAIEDVPASIKSLTDLETMDLIDCKRLKILSTSICKLKSLASLYLNNCSRRDSFPEIMEKMEHLLQIQLVSTAIKELPSSIKNVPGLLYLIIAHCSELHSLPQNLWNLKSLCLIYGQGTAITQLPSSITDLNKVKALKFSECRGLVLPDSLSSFSSLTELDLAYCDLTEIPQDIGCLLSLERLHLHGNNFESLPSSIKHLSQLEMLILRNCNMLHSFPELPLGLKDLDASDCWRLQSFPKLPSPLRELDASVLDLLSKPRADPWEPTGFLFALGNCMKFHENTNSNILADSQRRFQHLVIASLRKLYEEIHPCFPESRIPEWFSHQSSGSFIKIPRPPFGCDRNVIGFALCAVIAFENPCDTRYEIRLCCEYRFETKTFSKTGFGRKMLNVSNYYGIDGKFFYESDHVVHGYDPLLPPDDHYTAFSVDFHVILYGQKGK